MAKLPQECSTVLAAGGFEPQPVKAEIMPVPILKVLASKELALLLPSLTPQPRLIASTQAGIPLPDRNPNR